MGKKHTDQIAGGDIIFEGVAAGTISEGQGVWHDDTTEEWKLVQNGTPPFVMWGVALEDATIGKTFTILFSGVESFEAPATITEGAAIYIDSANSALTMTATNNQQIGHALTGAASGDDFLLHVDNPGVGISGTGGEETVASSQKQYMNSIGTTTVELSLGADVLGVEVLNDSAVNRVAIRFDATDAVFPSNGSSLTNESVIEPKEARYFPVATSVLNIIANAASTQVRVTVFYV